MEIKTIRDLAGGHGETATAVELLRPSAVALPDAVFAPPSSRFARLLRHRWAMLVLIPGLMLIVGGSLILLSRSSLREENDQNWRDRLGDDSAAVAKGAGRCLAQAYPILNALAERGPVVVRDPDDLVRLMRTLAYARPGLATVGVVIRDGSGLQLAIDHASGEMKIRRYAPFASVPASAEERPVLALSLQKLLIQTANDDLAHWSAPYPMGADGLKAIACAQSFRLPGAGAGDERCMALVEFDAVLIDRFVGAIVARTGGAKPFIFSAAGDMLTVPSPPQETGAAPDSGARSFADALANLPAEKEVRFFDHSNEGLPVLAAVRQVEIDHGPLLYASMVAPITALAASTTRLVHGALLIEVAAVLGAVAVAWLLTRMLTQQRRQVQQARRSANAARARLEEMGSYRLIRRLGVGGMGEIWQAEHHLLARPAALKLISMEALASTEAERAETRNRFAREARATARLRSPNTVTVYDFGFTRDGAFFYAMELLDGLDLELLVQAHGAQPAGRVVGILLQVCRSLAEAHQLGLVHRDIKPANIYLCRLGLEVDVVKVLDFGLVADCKGAARAVSGGLIQGTPAYMAPEQAKGLYSDARSDLYALGCVAYWLLSGRTLFDEEDSHRMLHKQVHELPPPLSAVARSLVPAGLEALVRALLDKDPDRRPFDSHAVIAALERVAIDGDDVWPAARARAWWATNHAHPAPAGPAAPAHPGAAIAISDPQRA
jgi:hypothetical protein